jgi:hypothetical protein
MLLHMCAHKYADAEQYADIHSDKNNMLGSTYGFPQNPGCLNAPQVFFFFVFFFLFLFFDLGLPLHSPFSPCPLAFLLSQLRLHCPPPPPSSERDLPSPAPTYGLP